MDIKSYFAQFPQGDFVDHSLHANQLHQQKQNMYDLDIEIVHKNADGVQGMMPNGETMTYCGHCSEHCSN